MPILSKDSPLVRDLPTSVDQTLPDWNAIQERLGGLPIAQKALTAQIAFENTNIFQRASQIALGGLASNVGMPTVNLMAEVTKVLGMNVEKVAVDVMAKTAGTLLDAFSKANENNEVIDKSVEAGAGMAVNMAAAVPMVGWVVKIAWNIGKAIAGIVQILKAQGKAQAEALYPPSKFDPAADRDVLNLFVLDAVRSSRDWNRIFSPPGYGKHASWQGPIGLQDLSCDGEPCGVRFMAMEPENLGFVPGTGWLHQSIEAFDTGKVIDPGYELLPSARQQCGWLWKMLSRQSGTEAFTISADQLSQRWWRYLFDMKTAILETDRVSDRIKLEILEKFNTSSTGPIFGWGSTLEMGSVDHESGRYAPCEELDTLRKRQIALLDTLACAYVDETYAALQDQGVKSLWHERRKQLLEHPARCQVDLAAVPDEEYRLELVERRKGTVCKIGATDLAWKGPKKHRIPRGRDGLGGADATRPPRRPWQRRQQDGGGLKAAGLFAALTGAWLVSRGK